MDQICEHGEYRYKLTWEYPCPVCGRKAAGAVPKDIQFEPKPNGELGIKLQTAVEFQADMERAIMDAIGRAGPIDYTEEGREMVARLVEATFPTRKFRVSAEPMPDRGVKVTITEAVEVIEINIEV